MDRLFTLEQDRMLIALKAVENEMIEESYPGEAVFYLQGLADNAYQYIREIFTYIKGKFAPGECTVCNMLTELYRVAATEEYTCYQELKNIGKENVVFASLKGNKGLEKVVFAMNLLRYYYLLKEKKHNSEDEWREVLVICGRIKELKHIGERKEKKPADLSQGEINEENFMEKLMEHLNKNMIGQEVLKKKLCTILYQWKYHGVRTNLLMIGPSGSGKNHVIETIRSFPGLGSTVCSYDCSQLTPNGFIGADVSAIFRKLKAECTAGARSFGECSTKGSIVFLDEVDKIINWNHDSRGESVNSMIQQQLLSSLAGTETIQGVDTSQVLFILGGAFPRIDDLKKENRSVGFTSAQEKVLANYKTTLREQICEIGAEAEFLGRIEEIVQMQRLTRQDLKAILLDEHIGAFSKKKAVFRAAGLDLEIEEDCIEAIVDLIEQETAGARSVKNIINEFADSRYFYDLKVGGYKKLTIHKGMLYGEAPKLEKSRG